MQNESSQSCGCASGAVVHENEHSRDGIGRRTFIAQSALMAASALLAACAAADSSTAPTTVSSTSLKVSDYPALSSVGGIALFSVSGNPLAVVRTGSTSFVALSRICPHQGTIVNVSGTGFLCPNHGARFDASGTWIGGERTSSMRSYAAAYDSAAGTVTIG
ncbi:MAG: Rieske [2Fe-2S] iron-sulfur protein [Gemmatimonadetes bacterium]|nr:Rieske [2Fe-2S] iron-sulfur protein [Gemmatimonadota bacterium]